MVTSTLLHSTIQVKKGKQAKYAWDDKERDGHIEKMKGSGSESSVVYRDTKV